MHYDGGPPQARSTSTPSYVTCLVVTLTIAKKNRPANELEGLSKFQLQKFVN